MTIDNLPQLAVDIDMTLMSLVDNVRQYNFEKQQYLIQGDTGYEREFTASLTGLQQNSPANKFDDLSLEVSGSTKLLFLFLQLSYSVYVGRLYMKVFARAIIGLLSSMDPGKVHELGGAFANTPISTDGLLDIC